MKRAFLVEKQGNYIVKVMTLSKEGYIKGVEISDTFNNKLDAEKKVAFINYLMKKCEEYSEKHKYHFTCRC